MLRSVFLSHARDDQVAARLVAERLTRAGYKVFVDFDSLVSGEEWSERVRRELESASAVLVLLSSKSRRSSWVQDEVQAALERKKVVIPVLLDDGAKENWLWPLVATRPSMTLDLRSGDFEGQMRQLLVALGSESEGDLPLPSTKADHSTIWGSILLAAVAVVSAAVGAIIALLTH